MSLCKLSIISAGACYKPRHRASLRIERNRKMAVLLRERRTGIEVILQYPWSDAQWFSGAGWEEDEAAVVYMNCVCTYVVRDVGLPYPVREHSQPCLNLSQVCSTTHLQTQNLPPILDALTLHTTNTRLHIAYRNNGVGPRGRARSGAQGCSPR